MALDSFVMRTSISCKLCCFRTSLWTKFWPSLRSRQNEIQPSLCWSWPMLLQSGVADRKAKVGSPSVHLSALVEASGTQPWVASFDLSDLPVPYRVWVCLSWDGDSFEDTPTRFEVAKQMAQEMAPFDDCLLASIGQKSNNQEYNSQTFKLPCWRCQLFVSWPSVLSKLSNFNQRDIQWFLKTCSCWSTATRTPMRFFRFLKTRKHTMT